MDRETILAEVAKLTLSQKKALRRLNVSLKVGARVTVKEYDSASTLHLRHRGENLFVRFSPRGRILEAKQWSAN